MLLTGNRIGLVPRTWGIALQKLLKASKTAAPRAGVGRPRDILSVGCLISCIALYRISFTGDIISDKTKSEYLRNNMLMLKSIRKQQKNKRTVFQCCVKFQLRLPRMFQFAFYDSRTFDPNSDHYYYICKTIEAITAHDDSIDLLPHDERFYRRQSSHKAITNINYVYNT